MAHGTNAQVFLGSGSTEAIYNGPFYPVKVTSYDYQSDIEKSTTEELFGTVEDMEVVAGLRSYTAELAGRVYQDSFGMILSSVFGTPSSRTHDSPGLYIHEFNSNKAEQNASVTIGVKNGDHLAAAIYGAKATKFTVSQETGKNLMYSASFSAKAILENANSAILIPPAKIIPAIETVTAGITGGVNVFSGAIGEDQVPVVGVKKWALEVTNPLEYVRDVSSGVEPRLIELNNRKQFKLTFTVRYNDAGTPVARYFTNEPTNLTFSYAVSNGRGQINFRLPYAFVTAMKTTKGPGFVDVEFEAIPIRSPIEDTAVKVLLDSTRVTY